MTVEAIQRHTVSVGETRLVRVNFADNLQSGVTLTGTPTVVEVTTTDLTLGSKSLNAATYTDDDGTTVAISNAVTFTVAGGTAANSPYSILVTTATNSTPAETLKCLVKLSFA